MGEARVSPLQSRIIELRDDGKQSWGTISRTVSEEFGRHVKRNYCQVVYQRAKKALAGYKDVAERQSEWERPTNRAKRYSRRQWRRFSPARRKLEWRLSPYAPDPVQRAIPPKRAKRKTGESLDEAKRSLAGLLRDRGNEEGARQVEASMGSPSSERVAEPMQHVSAAVAAPMPVAVRAPSAAPVRARLEPPRVLPPAAPALSAQRYAKLAFDWNESAGGEPIFRDKDGAVVDCVRGTGPRKDRWFLRDSNEVDEVLIFRVFCRGDIWVIRDPRDETERLIQVENAYTYESQSHYDCLYRPGRLRVSWLRITGIV